MAGVIFEDPHFFRTTWELSLDRISQLNSVQFGPVWWHIISPLQTLEIGDGWWKPNEKKILWRYVFRIKADPIRRQLVGSSVKIASGTTAQAHGIRKLYLLTYFISWTISIHLKNGNCSCKAGTKLNIIIVRLCKRC